MKKKLLPRKKNEVPLKTFGTPDNFISYGTSRTTIRFDDMYKGKNIGTLLIAFLELDFRAYEQRRQRVLSDLKNKDLHEDEQTYVKNWLLEELGELRGLHPYFNVLCESTLDTTHYMELLHNTFNLAKIQDTFKKATEFCLWRGNVPELEFCNTQQRYYIYHAMENSPFEEMGINAKVFYEPMQRNFDSSRKGLSLSELLSYVEDENTLFFHEQYFCNDVASLLYVEFNKMVVFDRQVKRCENCGLFFKLQGLRSARYCTRPADDKGNSCRLVCTNRNYKKKTSADQNYKIYRATLKRLNIRKNKDLISPEEYDTLKEKIAELRRDVQSGVLSDGDYKTQMDSV